MLRAIVKVGKSSKLKFNGVNSMRAISMREVNSLISKYDDISFVVLEDIDICNTDMKKKVSDILEHYATTMIVYKQDITSEEEEECDKLGIGYASNADEIYSYIENHVGYYVGLYPKEDTDEDETDADVVLIEENTEEDETDSTDNGLFDDDTDDEDYELANEQMRSLDEALESYTKNNEDEQESEVKTENIFFKQDEEEDMFDEFFKKREEAEKAKEETEKEDKVSEELLLKVGELEKENEKVKASYEQATDYIKKLNEVKESLEDRLKECEETLNSIFIDDEVTEVFVGRANDTEYKAKIAELEEELTKISEELTEKRYELQYTKEEYNKLIDSSAKQEDEIKKLKEQVDNDESEQLLNLEKSVSDNLSEMLNDTLDSILNLANELKANKEETEELYSSYETLKADLDNSKQIIKQLRTDNSKLVSERDNAEANANSKLVELKNQLNNLNVDKIELAGEIESKDSLIESKENKIKQLQTELTERDRVIEDNQKLIQGQQNKINSLSRVNVDELKNEMAAKDDMIDKQKKEIESLRKSNMETLQNISNKSNEDSSNLRLQVSKSKTMIQSLNSKIESLEYENNVLRTKNTTLLTKDDKKADIVCEYNARGCIIPVYGGGSYGVTTTVLSLAHKLEGKVLVMDLDVVSPKIESWVNKKPFVDGVPEIKNKMMATCFSSVLYKGVDYFIDNMDKFIQNIEKNKNGSVDYFSGHYSGLTYKMIEEVDWNQLLNYLGNCYNYIVVDLGRLGGSESQTGLIKMFNRISYNDIAVCMHSDGDVRSMMIRLKSNNINNDKVVWLLNLAENNKMTPTMKKAMVEGRYTIMVRSMGIYNKQQRFDKASVLKASLTDLMNKVLN